MKKTIKLITLFAASALLTGCGEQPSPTTSSSSTSSSSSSSSETSSGSTTQSTSGEKTVRSFTINFDDASWKSEFSAGTGLDKHVERFTNYLNNCNTFGDKVISSATPYNLNSTAQCDNKSLVAGTLGSSKGGGSLHLSFTKDVKTISLSVSSYWSSNSYSGSNYDTESILNYGETTVESTWRTIDLKVASATEGPAKSATIEMLENDGPYHALHLQTNLDAEKGRVALHSLVIDYYVD